MPTRTITYARNSKRILNSEPYPKVTSKTVLAYWHRLKRCAWNTWSMLIGLRKTPNWRLFTEVRFIVPCEWIGLGGRIFSNADSPHLCIRMPAWWAILSWCWSLLGWHWWAYDVSKMQVALRFACVSMGYLLKPMDAWDLCCFLNRRWTQINADEDFRICVYLRPSAVKNSVLLSPLSTQNSEESLKSH